MIITREIFLIIDYYNTVFEVLSQKLDIAIHRDEFQKKEIFDDWLQFHWEIVLESSVCMSNEFLSPYGDGTDSVSFTGEARFRFNQKSITHKIVCSSRGQVVDLISKDLISFEKIDFYKFISKTNQFNQELPPFDYSLLVMDDGTDILVENKSIDYFKILL